MSGCFFFSFFFFLKKKKKGKKERRVFVEHVIGTLSMFILHVLHEGLAGYREQRYVH
jgi:hypothetical protein